MIRARVLGMIALRIAGQGSASEQCATRVHRATQRRRRSPRCIAFAVAAVPGGVEATAGLRSCVSRAAARACAGRDARRALARASRTHAASSSQARVKRGQRHRQEGSEARGEELTAWTAVVWTHHIDAGMGCAGTWLKMCAVQLRRTGLIKIGLGRLMVRTRLPVFDSSSEHGTAWRGS